MQFPVGDRTFDEVSKLAFQKGIKLEPLVRLTEEKYPGSPDNLPEGLRGLNSVEINGLLSFKDRTSAFSLRRVEGKQGYLSVDVGDQNLIRANELVESLNSVFQTDRTLPSRIALTSTKAAWDQLGCFLIISIILTCLFFFGYGIYRYFISP